MTSGLVADVLRQHGRRIDPNHPGYGNCRCGFVVEMPDDWAGHVAEAVTTALAEAGLSVVKSRDIIRALSREPNFLDAGGRLLETARWDYYAFLAACPHPAESVGEIDDGSLSCWRCDQPVGGDPQ